MNMQMEGSYVLAVVMTGMIVVFIALILLIAFVSIMGKIFDSVNGKKEKKNNSLTEVAAPKAFPAMEIEDGISDEVVAVIAAAVASMSGNFALKSVKRVSAKSSRRGAWGVQGIAESTQVF